MDVWCNHLNIHVIIHDLPIPFNHGNARHISEQPTVCDRWQSEAGDVWWCTAGTIGSCAIPGWDWKPSISQLYNFAIYPRLTKSWGGRSWRQAKFQTLSYPHPSCELGQGVTMLGPAECHILNQSRRSGTTAVPAENPSLVNIWLCACLTTYSDGAYTGGLEQASGCRFTMRLRQLSRIICLGYHH